LLHAEQATIAELSKNLPEEKVQTRFVEFDGKSGQNLDQTH
jgi:hypothetical protein